MEKRTKAETRKLEKNFINRWSVIQEELTQSLIRQKMLSETFGVQACGCSLIGERPYQELYNDDWDTLGVQPVPKVIDVLKHAEKKGYHLDPSIVVISSDDFGGVATSKDTIDYRVERIRELGFGIEVLGKITVSTCKRPNRTPDKEDFLFVRLSGDLWFEHATTEAERLSSQNDLLSTADSEPFDIRDFLDLFFAQQSVDTQLLEVSTREPVLISGDLEWEGESIKEGAYIQLAGEKGYVVRATPKSTCLTNNTDLFYMLGSELEIPCALKEGREFVASITDGLSAAHKEALKLLYHKNGNVTGSELYVTKKLKELEAETALMRSALKILQDKDFSCIEDAAVAQIPTCMKLIAKSKLDDRVKKLAEKIIKMN